MKCSDRVVVDGGGRQVNDERGGSFGLRKEGWVDGLEGGGADQQFSSGPAHISFFPEFHLHQLYYSVASAVSGFGSSSSSSEEKRRRRFFTTQKNKVCNI
ncbi:hypothetical protein CMV_005451 [Castanea mollissima]|uniref:Uncharacterized protein n=1 Tax=Castanea mollissima TaxID=60419 RepID=A0A8J4RQ85_9ROSI|nr:hypothetical protein CMV_005451 [Castanea mollissima]